MRFCNVNEGLAGFHQQLPNFIAKGMQIIVYKQIVVILRDGVISFGDEHGDETDDFAEPRPIIVHFLQNLFFLLGLRMMEMQGIKVKNEFNVP